MRLINRQVEIALDVLQLLERRSSPRFNAQVLSVLLQESELFIYQILSTLKKAGWVGATKGPGGGYFLVDGIEKKSLRNLFAVFHKEWTYNVMKSDVAASERVRQLFMRLLDHCTLEDVFLMTTKVVDFKPTKGEDYV